MPKSCIVCSAEASPELQLQYCDQCQSALYCSKACQRIDWKKQHKKICKLLNAGHGDMQVRTDIHTNQFIASQEAFERIGRGAREHGFFKLFEESTFEGSRAAAQKMKNYAKLQTRGHQQFLLSYSLQLLLQSDSKMLLWPNSPFLVMLQFLDPSMLSGYKGTSITPLHDLSARLDPSDYTTHVNQLILAKQLIEHGANVNAISIPQDITPLHRACYSGVVTNLDFVELLLENGADPNAQDHIGNTPLMYTFPDAPGAAKFLLKWPTTDVNITTRSGASFLATVRSTITDFSDKVALPDSPDRVQHQFAIQQWRVIEDILVEMGATDTGITALS
jgi:hypothetical protein